MHTKKTSAFVWCTYLVGFEHILKGMPHLSSEKVQWLYYATLFSPSRIRNFVSYFIHDTLWAYPSVTQLKKLMLLFHFIPHLAVDWLVHFSSYKTTGQRQANKNCFKGNIGETSQMRWSSSIHVILIWTELFMSLMLACPSVCSFFFFFFFFNNNNSWSFHLKATYPCGEMTQKRMCHYYSV